MPACPHREGTKQTLGLRRKRKPRVGPGGSQAGLTTSTQAISREFNQQCAA